MQIHLYLPDVERYRQLALVDERHWAPLNERFDGSSMIDAWKPVDVEPLYAKRPVSDFPALGNLPVLSTRAAEALQDLLNGCGELLPLRGGNGEYFVLNVFLLDALDEEASELKTFRSSGRVMRVVRHAFREQALGRPIFKLPQQPRGDVYVGDPFVQRVTKTGLVGLKLDRVVWSQAD
jgi:hypothetical protein